MLTWKLWNRLHALPRGYAQMLLVQNSANPKPVLLIFLGVVVWGVLYRMFSISAIPIAAFVFLNYFVLQAAWKISGVLANLRESGQGESLTIKGVGAFEIAFDLCRQQAQLSNHNAKDETKLWRICIAFVCGVLALGAIFSPNYILIIAISLAELLIWITLLVFEYRQSFVMGNLISLLASTIGQRAKVHLATIVSIVGMQLACYAAPITVFFSVFFRLYRPTSFDISPILFVGFSIMVAAYITREIIIYTLWRWLKLRFNDDALNLKAV